MQTSNFRKVVSVAIFWRYDGKYYMNIVENFVFFQQWINIENPLRIDKIIAMSLVYYFFWDTV